MQYEWLTPAEAADYLRVTPQTLSKWRSRQVKTIPNIPYSKINQRVYYRKSDLDQFLEKNKQTPGDDHVNPTTKTETTS